MHLTFTLDEISMTDRDKFIIRVGATAGAREEPA